MTFPVGFRAYRRSHVVHGVAGLMAAVFANGCGGDNSSAEQPGGVVVNGAAGATAMPAGPAGSYDCDRSDAVAVPELQLTNLAAGFSSPIYVAFAPGDDSRMFVVEKGGTVQIVRDGQLLDAPFLDISDLVSERSNEMGLLGLAFHPQFEQVPKIYVYYSSEPGGANHRSVVAEYSVAADDEDRVDPESARVLLGFEQPQGNHNGGNLQFGPDGYLYIASGDGGGGGDQHGPTGNGQNLQTLLGKILRIDVDSTEGDLEYGLPPGNMQPPDALGEIWSYGWRNPWRFSFDACTGDQYVADVGQDALEEVDFEPVGSSSGRNYGWRLMEGDRCFAPSTGCDAVRDNLQLPIASYGRDVGVSITGGYVYRGSAIADLRGYYLYADFARASFFALKMRDGQRVAEPVDITSNLNRGGESAIASFGQDNAGNLYVVSLSGSISRIDGR